MRIDVISITDVAAVQKLFEATPQYFLNVSGSPAGPLAAQEALTVFPPGLTRDPLLLGAFDGGELVGIAVAAVGFPAAHYAHLGLLLVREDRQGQGVGRRLHTAYLEHVGAYEEVTALRLSVVSTNAATAQPFWLSLGYLPTGERKPYIDGSVRAQAIIFEQPRWALAQPPSAG